MHYNESGYHLGTADVFVKRRGAKKIIEDFHGIALDGKLVTPDSQKLFR